MELDNMQDQIDIVLFDMLDSGIVKGNLKLAYQLLTWSESTELAIERRENMQKEIARLKETNSRLLFRLTDHS